MGLSEKDAVDIVGDKLLPLFTAERSKLDDIDRWARWDHDKPHSPPQATTEYTELSKRAQAPWGDLIVSSIAQTLFVEGYRRPDQPNDASGWRRWQANGMDGRQVALHRAVVTFGQAFMVTLPGKTITGQSMPVMRGVSPREMVAVYDDVADDEWPLYALRVRKVRHDLTRLVVFDDEALHHLTLGSIGDTPRYERRQAQPAGLCPITRFTDRFDLEGRATGEIEPFIPVMARIDQSSFDRLVVQRFASWIVRTVAGMSVSETVSATGETTAAVKKRLKVEDLLVADDKDTKFGSLPATPLSGFIEAKDADVRELIAVSQTPALELGQMVNLSAEALDAAKDSQNAKSESLRHTLGEQHEQQLRLAAYLDGDTAGAEDFESQVRWADTSIRSLAQAADAFGKMVDQLQIPPEVLWAKIPGFTQLDVEEALSIRKEALERDDLLDRLADGQTSSEPSPAA